MSAPTPAQPSEGAMFLRYLDVPDDWQILWSNYEECAIAWMSKLEAAVHEEVNTGQTIALGQVVEARPKPEPLVAVMLPKSVVESRAAGYGSHFDAISVACAEALERES